MKFHVDMLKDFVATSMSAEEIGDLLTMAGFELEGIEGEVLDIKVVSNRGDGLSVLGLAREVLAKDRDAKPTDLYARAVARFEDVPTDTSAEDSVQIQTDSCTRYAACVIENVTNGEAPAWIRERLEAAGMRSISLLVDLTNYVMLEQGQPLHAFDVAKLGTDVVVRQAQGGEKLTTLNGVEHELLPNQMMICDRTRPVAAAGVMGGLDTEVDAETTKLLLESAHFVNTSVRKTRKQLGLNTEASYRFERSVDPEGVVSATRRFIELLRQATPSVVVHEIVDVYPTPPTERTIPLRLDRASKLLGMKIGNDDAVHYLSALGCEVAGHGDPYFVNPPTWRPDLVREEDLIEELGRVHGYERIPEHLPEGTTTQGGLRGEYLARELLVDAMTRLGFVQTVSHSLRDLSVLDGTSERIGPRQPGSPDTAYLRNSLLPGLAEAAARNGGRDISLFEIGRIFEGRDREYPHLSALTVGRTAPESRNQTEPPMADFFTLKGALEEALAAIGVRAAIESAEADHRFHPHRFARILAGSVEAGFIGQLHPDIASECGLAADAIVFELWLDRVALAEPKLELRSISRNPAVRRDIALLIDKSVPYRDIEAKVRATAGDLLERVWLFDVYEGQGIPEGKHSLGIGIQLRKFGSNFTDEEANRVREHVVAALAELGGTTR